MVFWHCHHFTDCILREKSVHANTQALDTDETPLTRPASCAKRLSRLAADTELPAILSQDVKFNLTGAARRVKLSCICFYNLHVSMRLPHVSGVEVAKHSRGLQEAQMCECLEQDPMLLTLW